MYVGVMHRIHDADAFFSRGEALFNPPQGIRGIQFCPSKDATQATCLWEGPSVDAVRELIDGTLGDASENTFFEIDPDRSMGLPERAAAEA
jgi:hypothetical protein